MTSVVCFWKLSSWKPYFEITQVFNQTYINSQDSCNIPAHNSAPHAASQTKELKQEVEEVSKSP